MRKPPLSLPGNLAFIFLEKGIFGNDKKVLSMELPEE